MTSLDPLWVFLYRPLYFWGVSPSLGGWSPGVDGLILPRFQVGALRVD